MTPIPLLDLSAAHAPFRDQLKATFERVLDAERYILGPEVEAFEREVASWLGVAHAVGVSSGTDGLVALLTAHGIGPGDEVITTPLSFVATAEAILRVGAVPVFADLAPNSFGLSESAVRALLTPNTRALLDVHLYGRASAAPTLRKLAAEHGMVYLEDACQALGAKVDGRYAGTLGQGGVFSFFPSKPLGGFGDGGLVVTDDPALATRLRALRAHGSRDRKSYGELGGNYRLDALQAALLRVLLPALPSWLTERRRLAREYHQALAEHPHLQLPAPDDEQQESAWALYTLRVPQDRDGLQRHLRESGVESVVYYPTLLREQPLFSDRCRAGTLTEALLAAAQVLSIPLYPGQTQQQQARVIAILNDWNPIFPHSPA